jgi:hypothetical protein
MLFGLPGHTGRWTCIPEASICTCACRGVKEVGAQQAGCGCGGGQLPCCPAASSTWLGEENVKRSFLIQLARHYSWIHSFKRLRRLTKSSPSSYSTWLFAFHIEVLQDSQSDLHLWSVQYNNHSDWLLVNPTSQFVFWLQVSLLDSAHTVDTAAKLGKLSKWEVQGVSSSA